VAKAGVDEIEWTGNANQRVQGVDDVIAMLLAFSAKPEELDILMVSLTFGNVEVQKYVSYFPSACVDPKTRICSRRALEWFPTCGYQRGERMES
jgi:hypothetical protein